MEVHIVCGALLQLAEPHYERQGKDIDSGQQCCDFWFCPNCQVNLKECKDSNQITYMTL